MRWSVYRRQLKKEPCSHCSERRVSRLTCTTPVRSSLPKLRLAYTQRSRTSEPCTSLIGIQRKDKIDQGNPYKKYTSFQPGELLLSAMLVVTLLLPTLSRK